MSDPVFEVDLTLKQGSFLLQLDFESRSRVLGVFGPSGSGKTTLLEAIAGLRLGASGVIRVGGHEWLNTSEKSIAAAGVRKIGYVPQDHLLFPHYSVRQNLEAGFRRAAKSGVDPGRVFKEVLRVLELEPLLERMPHELSGGERQRVALGRALCSGPSLLLLDEPLASLDMKLRHRILPFLVSVKESFDLPILIVSHNPVELLALCDEVVVLRDGSRVAQGLPTEVFSRSDVYATARLDGFENILHAELIEQGEHASRLRVGDPDRGQVITTERVDAEVHQVVTLGLAANEIFVAKEQLRGVSARNFLFGAVDSLEFSEHRYLLVARLASDPSVSVVVELTRDAVEELGIGVGDDVWLFFKSSSVAVYA
ncbi:ATP-binding cassette domain-containing protein [Pelagicoccus sp. SDUM812003]|uniref:molybdenum ABC transporter ATP-binding protein n=1 Tax=Pelagicoccus sp. SDUM812003 TaxID=3041267 RepID=UPI00281085C1|nr:ATP-binding cassette domain-containing protein [Pelagicoccus sp. SDUM812003]MDQ8202631.1 ATP-binding cassette domain-containing protein [Pelagicoccus sp. SDUM812003]